MQDQGQALHTAVLAGAHEKVRDLLDAGADVDARDEDGETALIKAAARADAAMVELLLERGADPEALSSHGQTALCCAAEASRWVAHDAAEDDQVVLSRALQIRFDDASQSVQTLEPFPERDSLATVEALLATGADPNPPTVDESPLASAVRLGRLEVIEALLAAGARVDPAARENAQLYEQREALELLRGAGGSAPRTDDRRR